MGPMREYLKLYREVGQDAFARQVADPVLVHDADAADKDSDRLFKTTVIDARTIARLLQKPAATEYVVFELTKRSGGMFPDRISVGRTRASDVHLDYPQVSKFHAYFSVNPATKEMHITDANATNGTFVNGKRLEPNSPVPLQDGAVIMFGSHGFTYYSANGFANYLRRTGS